MTMHIPVPVCRRRGCIKNGSGLFPSYFRLLHLHIQRLLNIRSLFAVLCLSAAPTKAGQGRAWPIGNRQLPHSTSALPAVDSEVTLTCITILALISCVSLGKVCSLWRLPIWVFKVGILIVFPSWGHFGD